MSCKYILFIYAVMSSLFLIGCKRGDVDNADGGGPVEITYWCNSAPVSVDLAKILVDEWNSTREDIHVNLVPIPASHSSEETILAAIAGGTTPDVTENIWSGAVPTYSAAGGMVKLDEMPGYQEHIKSRVSERMVSGIIGKDGHHYALPYRTNPVMVLYNPKMFRDAGVKAPLRTYSEFYEAAAKICIDADDDGQFDKWMGNVGVKPVWWHRMFDFYCFYIAASGGKRLIEDEELTFENDDAEQAMGFFKEMFDKGYYPRTAFQTDPFTAGQVATLITGPWHLTYLEKYKPDGMEYDLMSLPVPDDRKVPESTFASTHCLGIFSTTKHPEETWEFVKFLTSRESDLELLTTANQIPVRINLLKDKYFRGYFKKNPLMLKFAQQIPGSPPMDTDESFKEILDAVSQEYEACAVYGRKSSKDAIEGIVNRTKVIMDWNRSR